MKRTSMVCFGSLLLVSSPAFADFYGFTKLTNNTSIDLASQLKVEVTDAGAGKAAFKFTNNVGIASNVSEVYFDDGPLLGLATIASSATVNFSQGGSPPDLPGGQGASPPFHVTQDFFATADNPSPANGINQASDSLTLTFNLINGKNFADIISAMNDGSLRIGLHIQSIGTTGQSDSYINGPPSSVPSPTATALGLIGLVPVLVRRGRSLLV